MKKRSCSRRFLSMALCISMALSSSVIFCSAADNSESLTPPPELIILEGEEWIPDAVDPLLMTTYGSDDDCRHNGASPANYRYIGAVRGSTQADILAVDGLVLTISLLLPQPYGSILSVVSYIANLLPSDELEGEYIRHQYMYNVGPDPNMYWFHTYYAFATQNGKPVGSACHATFSPKQVQGPFQD